MSSAILGIEIGGTKLQFGVGNGTHERFDEFVRHDIDRSRGADGIRQQIEATVNDLSQRFKLAAISYGFGGPVNQASGSVITSHQVAGWTDFPLVHWTRERFDLPAVIGNDCDVAALGESILGAGRDHRVVFYVTVGTGIGGGLVIDGQLHAADRPAVAEIGHMRPGVLAASSNQTVESIASGLGIEQKARALCESNADGADELLQQCNHQIENISGQAIADAASAGNPIAVQVLDDATRTLGWAIAQVVTLVAPNVVIVGGGVPMMKKELFFAPLQRAVRTYCFEPLRDSCELIPPKLGEHVVVHGAIVNAAREFC